MSLQEVEKIVITNQAFQLLGGEAVVEAEPWDQLVEVTAFKLDLLAFDQIRVQFEYASGLVIEVSEDMLGFTELMDTVNNHIPDFPDQPAWRPKVVCPPFETCQTTLWYKGV